MNSTPNGECGVHVLAGFGFNDTRFGATRSASTPPAPGRSQDDRSAAAPKQGINPLAVRRYCNQYGDSVLNGWGERRGEWQFGLGIQHEILPRLSGEFVYHRRTYSNITMSDQLHDRLRPVQRRATCTTCQDDSLLNYSNPSYDFFTVKAPTDPSLPGGGGYTILGLYDVHDIRRGAGDRPDVHGRS